MGAQLRGIPNRILLPPVVVVVVVAPIFCWLFKLEREGVGEGDREDIEPPFDEQLNEFPVLYALWLYLGLLRLFCSSLLVLEVSRLLDLAGSGGSLGRRNSKSSLWETKGTAALIALFRAGLLLYV